MILPRRPHLGRMLRYVGWPLFALVLWDVLIVVAFKILHWSWVGTSAIPLALYGSAIGIIVGFRNNSAYARWWEGRILWGQIVNHSRALGRQVCTTSRADPQGAAELAAMKQRVIYLQISYVHALARQLRGLDALSGAETRLAPADLKALTGQKNPALALQLQIGSLLREMRQRGWITGLEWQAMDTTLHDLLNAQGGTERIKNTPLPKQYDFFPMLFVQIYCLLLPIGMVEDLGWFTPLGSTLVGFMFLALDRIGRDLEDPFENTVYDVPVSSIARTIEINLRQMLGETELPEAVSPVDGVLW